MKRLLICIALMASFAYAQDKPKETTLELTAKEQKEWQDIVKESDTITANIRTAMSDLKAAKSKDDIADPAWRFRAFIAESDNFQTKLSIWVFNVQSAHNCKDCTIDKDGKKLVAPEAPKK